MLMAHYLALSGAINGAFLFLPITAVSDYYNSRKSQRCEARINAVFYFKQALRHY